MNQTTTTRILFLVFLCLGFTFTNAKAQGSINGKITDEKGEVVAFGTAQLESTTLGASSDDNGMYEIKDIPAGTYVLIVSYIGYATYSQTVTVGSGTLTVDVIMKADYQNLNEVVVVGYGTKQVKDLTGSVTSVGSDQFLNGNNVTPEQLIAGKVAGVQIVSNGGAPGEGSTIRIRGGSSLNASNDPLIVIDGVPIAPSRKSDGSSTIAGAQDPLSLINPNDIENITVLKDASAAAIYGSRAANGVIIITTKKAKAGDNRFHIEFSTNSSLSRNSKEVSMLSADQLRTLIDSGGTANQKALVSDSGSTDWQKEIYRNAFSMDNNLTFAGGIKQLPYRLSLGYLIQEGVLLRSELERSSASINLGPSFLDDHLKVDVNFKVAYSYNFFANRDAIGTSVGFDPTKPVHSDTSAFGGWFEWLDPSTGNPASIVPRNPLGLIYQKEDNSHVTRYLGNIQLDYMLHFFPELRANLNMGGDWSRSHGTVFVDSTAAADFDRGGRNTHYQQKKNNKLFEFYLNYLKQLRGIHSKIDLTAGYSYQDWLTEEPTFPDLNVAGDTIAAAPVPNKTQNTLISFYGRLNYTFADRYLFTFTLRDDGSSRFNPDNRWGLFPSAAFAWRISDESFLKNSKTLSNLKLRLGYGITGQQDINNDYPYLANYATGDLTAQYEFGNVFYYVLRPAGYDANIKWEETKTYNVGLDFGFFNGRINGSIDVYKKITSDLLSTIPVPAGTNFTNLILTNVGAMENKGFEFTLDLVPYDTKDFKWDIGGNISYNHNEITKLSEIVDTSSVGIPVGGISGGVGNQIQIQSLNHPTFSFYVYQQLYNEDGKPIEAGYADINGDSIINSSDRVISKHHPAPTVYAALYSSFRYKNWSAGFQLRGSWGNWMYNNVASNYGWYDAIDGSRHFINNLSTNYYDTQFKKAQYLSDAYLENASFVRCDNISLGYTFRNLLSKKIGLTVTGIIQNLFVISGYSGLDPEISSGIDNNIYPRPTIYSLNLNIKL